MRIEVIKEVTNPDGLSFQYAKWNWDNEKPSFGYRFIWRDEETGNLKPARGQAYIPNVAIMFELIAAALREGWLNENI